MNNLKQCLAAIAMTLLPTAAAMAQPQMSTDNDTHWYLITFNNGGNMITSAGSGSKVLTLGFKGADGQYWKLTGRTDSCTLTDKAGNNLYVSATTKNTKVYAGTHAPTPFKLVSKGSEVCEIVPLKNSAVALNQWGGPGDGHEVGLWDSGTDANNRIKFSDASQLAAPYANIPRLIPYPKRVQLTDGKTFDVSKLTAFVYSSDSLEQFAEEFADKLSKCGGPKLTVSQTGSAGAGTIFFSLTDTLSAEAYHLEIGDNDITAVAGGRAGLFYALQTIKQLLPDTYFTGTATSSWTVPCLVIDDAPAFGYRGYMLDVARHFFSKREVERILDIMAFYKMNRFHWHLTDDQGWRIEIPEYPRLTEVGSRRAGSFVNAGDGKFFDDTEYGKGMYFTLNDLREVVAYAKARNIEILPEIDLPGHMVAAIAAYPNLSCDSTKTYSVRIDGGISKDVLNIGNDKVIDFLKCVLGHIAEVFPYPYIHIGGDECPTGQWSTNAECLKRVSDNGLSGVNELQPWLVEQLGTYLKDNYDKDIVVWDELLTHWTADNKVKPVIMAWNNANKTSAAADKGFKSIFVPYQSLYLDMMQVSEAEADVNEVYQGGWGPSYVNSLPTVYNVNPLVSLSGRENMLLGVQGNMWTETTNDSVQLEYQLLPRLLALSESGWKKKADKDWLSFFFRMQKHETILKAGGYTYAPHYFMKPKRSAWETNYDEARQLLADTKPGEAGYVSQAACDSLAQAMKSNNADTLALAITTFKNATITQPDTAAVYQLVSASTYYKKRYAGSTIYQKDGGAYVHYTLQNEPEELWQFVSYGKGFRLKNVMTGNTVSMTINKAVKLGTTATTIRVDKATVKTGAYDYVPGAVVISSTSPYKATKGTTTKRLFVKNSGEVQAVDDPTLCNPGTWKLVRIDDYSLQLKGLVTKCSNIIADRDASKAGQPSDEAVAFLSQRIVEPATVALQQAVSKETYTTYMELYKQYLAMPKIQMTDLLDTTAVYRIRNAYFTDYFAALNATTGDVAPVKAGGDYVYTWKLSKNSDGSYNLTATNGMTTTFASDAEGANINNSGSYSWHLIDGTADSGEPSIMITDQQEKYGWYTNPDAWKNNVILKPKEWGGSKWTFEKQNVTTGIAAVAIMDGQHKQGVHEYNLLGIPVTRAYRGIVVRSDGKKISR